MKSVILNGFQENKKLNPGLELFSELVTGRTQLGADYSGLSHPISDEIKSNIWNQQIRENLRYSLGIEYNQQKVVALYNIIYPGLFLLCPFLFSKTFKWPG